MMHLGTYRYVGKCEDFLLKIFVLGIISRNLSLYYPINFYVCFRQYLKYSVSLCLLLSVPRQFSAKCILK